MAAITLVEMAKQYPNEVLRPTIIEEFARQNQILANIPIVNIAGGAYKFNRESDLGSVAFRGVNETYTANNGKLDPIVEALAIAGGDLDVDKFVTDTGGPGVRATYTLMKVKALAHAVGHKILK